eukprot:scaffold7.g3537.t1
MFAPSVHSHSPAAWPGSEGAAGTHKGAQRALAVPRSEISCAYGLPPTAHRPPAAACAGPEPVTAQPTRAPAAMSDWSDSSLDSQLLAGARKKRGRRELSDESEAESSDASLEEESELEEQAPRHKAPARAPPRKRQAHGAAAAGASAPQDEMPELDEDDLIEDEEDRKRLDAMTELERELELAERAERRQQELQRARLLGQQAAGAGPPQKGRAKGQEGRKKAAAEEGGKKKERAARSGREVREEAAKKSAIQELRAARERKAKGEEARARQREGESEEEGVGTSEASGEREWEEGTSEEDEEGEREGSEMELDEEEREERRRRRRGGEEEEEEMEAAEDAVKSITVRRYKLEQWWDKPFFDGTMPGCMVRVRMGSKAGLSGEEVVLVETRQPGLYKDSGQPWKSPYAFGPPDTRTAKWLLVARGHSERFVPMALVRGGGARGGGGRAAGGEVSNQSFTVAELESYNDLCARERKPLVTTRHVEEVRARLLAAESYRYTAEDVARELEEKRAKGAAPRNAALEKARLERQRDHALERGEQEEAVQVDERIAALDAAIAASKASDKAARLAALNRRNEGINVKNALDNVGHKVEGVSRQDSGAAHLDPFSRRATRSRKAAPVAAAGAGQRAPPRSAPPLPSSLLHPARASPHPQPPRVYWNTKKQAAAAMEDGDLFGELEEEEEAARQAGGSGDGSGHEGSLPVSPRAAAAAARAGGFGGGAQRPVDLASVVDLGSLDLSLLDAPPKQSLLARKLVGGLAGWAAAPPPPPPPPGAGRQFSLAEYRALRGAA